MNKAFAQQLITSPSEVTTNQVFNGVDGIFWVDWKEGTDDIVELVARSINSSDLSPDYVDDQWRICFRGKVVVVEANSGGSEQDDTLLALNSALSGFYEVRYVKVSDGGDTLAFMTLSKDDWQNFEAQFGDQVGAAFGRILPNSPVFGGEQDDAGLMKTLRPIYFSGLKLRLCTVRDIASLPGPRDRRDDSGPLIEPLFGDILLTFDQRDARYTVTIDEAKKYLADSRELRQLAQPEHRKSTLPKCKFETRDAVHMIHGDGCMAAVLAVWPELDICASKLGSEHLVAFPHMDMMYFVLGQSADKVTALRAAVDSVCTTLPNVLSTQLFVRTGMTWVPFAG